MVALIQSDADISDGYCPDYDSNVFALTLIIIYCIEILFMTPERMSSN